MDSLNIKRSLIENGYIVMDLRYQRELSSELIHDLSQLPDTDTSHRTGGCRFPERYSSSIKEIIESTITSSLIEDALGGEAYFVRGILFDKTPTTNWKVPWHQDTTIAVKERRDVPGYGPWSVKGGVHHVQPPEEILNAMVSLRICIDPCEENHGPLKVIPGSHKEGRLSSADIDTLVSKNEPHVCTGEPGSALLMKPLLVHSSSRAECPSHRRILHLDYCAQELGNGLEWN